MFLQRGSRALRRQWTVARAVSKGSATQPSVKLCAGGAPRWFSESRRMLAVKPVLLADIGEGVF